jgi:non-specific serine/threonine protein kinase/serine/threonine-protein kinase
VTPERWARVKQLLSSALDLPMADRAAHLARAGGEDRELIAEVQSLLDSHEQPGAFLDTVTHEFRSEAFAATSSARSHIGERIGAYRIAGLLGSGGMGDVFNAVRDDDHYEAEVAIKLMRADMRSALTEQRFKAERQMLAGLDHRNIARLLDGGTTDAGMPYVVMELVIGVPIDRFCGAQALSLRDRVQLFLQVCAAVSYAHQHLIVHRDLKPNNILVTTDGSVKLLDFGIAKLLEADTDTAVAAESATATTLRAMTLEYASPEQVGGGTVTTVSDVYSLGVVLYHLLTGKSPYGARTTDAARMAEILSDTMPARPSLVEHKVDGDLDNILLMALRKEPQRRYGSVEQLANDLRNYLSGMPVQARGNSFGYRAGKFVRRRKVEIAAGLVMACSLLGGLGFSIREARVADQERRIAQEHFDSVRKLANTLLFDIHDEMAKVPGSTKSREMLVKTSLEYLDTLFKEAGGDVALQQELATAYKKVGDIQGAQFDSNTGDHPAALISYARSIALLEPLAAADPADHRIGISLSRVYVQQASLMLVAGKGEPALAAARKGTALLELHQGSIPDPVDRTRQLLFAYWGLTEVLAYLGQSPEAMVTLKKMLRMCEAFYEANPNNIEALSILSKAYNNASMHTDPNLPVAERTAHIVAMLKRGLWASEQLVALAPQNDQYRYDMGLAQSNLGRQLAAQGDLAGALEFFQAASAAVGAKTRDPNDARAAYISALVDSHMGEVLFRVGRIDEAHSTYVRCDAVLQALVTRSGSLRIEYALGQNLTRLGLLFAARAEGSGSTSAGLKLWRQSHDYLQRGMVLLKKVAASVVLEPMDQKPVDDGAAALARVDALLAAS